MNRKEFILGGLGTAMVAGCKCPLCGWGKVPFHLAMAGYTLHSFKTDDALAFCERHGFRYLCVKDMHLPFDATPAQIREFRNKCADHGVTPYGVGPIYMSSAEEARKRFDYAAELGVKIMSGVPGEPDKDGKTRSSRRLCEAVSALAAEYDIRFAIHNHGRNPKTGNPQLYPAVPETYEMIRDLDRRMGLCVDWAYTYADGLDCTEVAHTYADRIFDGHVRCLSDDRNGSAGINPAKRVFDYDAIFAALKEIGYEGYLGLELANAFPKTPEWIDESRIYFEQLIAAV